MSTDEELTDLLNKFMRRLRIYLDNGGPEDVVDRVLAAATVAAAAGMILWPNSRKSNGIIGILAAATKQVWDRRKFWGLP